MSISSGNYTVGTNGNYFSWDEACYDIKSLTGNLTLTQISNTTLATTASINAVLNGYTLLFTSNFVRNNSVRYGNRWTTFLSTAASGFFLASNGPGILEFSGLAALQGAIPPLVNVFYCEFMTGLFKVHDCFCYCNTAYDNSIIENDRNSIMHIYNNIFTNSNQAFVRLSSVGSIIENCTGYNGRFGVLGIAGSTARNCAMLGTCTGCYGGGLSVINCASSDATGSVGLQNLNYTNEVQSNNYLKANFMDVLQTGHLWQNGTNVWITGHTKDFRGRLLPDNLGKSSIGAMTSWPTGMNL
jgi:hypothetical protein